VTLSEPEKAELSLSGQHAVMIARAGVVVGAHCRASTDLSCKI